jgi:hypothetical protein
MTNVDDALLPDGWLILKAGRGWYRPDAQGYTSDPLEAGRYTYDKAMDYSHPNGLEGPRDGIEIHHESEVPGAIAHADAGLLAALGGLMRCLLPIQMALIERELADDSLPRDAVLFSHMGSGCSDSVTVGEYQDAAEAARAAIAAAKGAAL